MAAHVRWEHSLAGRDAGGPQGGVRLFDLERRQNGNGTQPGTPSNTNGTTNNNNNNLNNGNQGAPLSVFTFIIAIALFVLVVSFVLLRIFVRNRRLRRLGIYPESPIERLLGGAPREYEDNLVPPRLWHANIADIQAHNAGAQSRAEKSMLGGNVGAGDIKEHGWDALMPVAAALPPSLYPIIYQTDAAANANATANAGNPTTTSPSDGQGALFSRIAPLRPDFWRRSTGEAVVAGSAGNANEVDRQHDPAAGQTGAASSGNVTGNISTGAGAAADLPERNEKIAASVNITVLISMPSHRTVFPSTKKSMTSTSSLRKAGSKVNASGTLSGPQSKLEEVDEDADLDALSFKGKARRTPSLRSVRTTASLKSQAEARREAFFAQAGGQDGDGSAVITTAEPVTYGGDEDEELPELVFGTASVPLYSKIVSSTIGARSIAPAASVAGPTLVSPTCDEITALVASAAQARNSKPVTKPAKKTSSGGDAEADADGLPNRRSVAGTSMEGGLSAAEEQSGLGDVVSRMMRPNSASGAAEAYELGDLTRPSFASGPSSSFVRDASGAPVGQSSSTAHLGLVQEAADMGTAGPLGTPITTGSESRPFLQHASSRLANSDPDDGSVNGTSNDTYDRRGPEQDGSVPAGSVTSLHTAPYDRRSTSTWHTGNETDEVAQIAALAVNLDREQSGSRGV